LVRTLPFPFFHVICRSNKYFGGKIIQSQTYLNIADNSGARKIMCIQVLGASNRKCAHIGDVIIAIIKEAVPNMPLEKSKVVRAVVIRTCKEFEHDNGMMI
jgi:large subunit ribosomal protein L14